MQQFPKRLPLYSTNTLLTVLDKGTLFLDEHHPTPLEVHCYSCSSFDEKAGMANIALALPKHKYYKATKSYKTCKPKGKGKT